MRTVLAAGLLMMLGASVARADPAVFPEFDIAKTCAAQAEYAYAATLGQSDKTAEVAACTRRERDNRDSAQALWPLASPKDKAECLGLADAKYGYLTRCLDSGVSIRTAR